MGKRSVSGILAFVVVATGMVSAAAGPVQADSNLVGTEVRSTYTSEFSLARPSGLATTSAGELIVVGPSGAQALRLTTSGRFEGTLTVRGLGPDSSIARDPVSRRLTTIRGRDLVTTGLDATIVLSDPALGSADEVAIDQANGDVWIRDARSVTLLDRSGSRSELKRVADAIAADDGRLYLWSRSDETLTTVDKTGSTLATYDLSSVDLGNVEAMTLAPSADPTDDPHTNSLYVADSGTDQVLGRMVEISLVQPLALAAPTETATLVRMVETSQWTPGSPDPSGVTYLPWLDRLQIVDSEVEETTGAGYHGVNMWLVDRGGVVRDTGTTFPAISKEPTGVGSRANPGTLFISDDSAGRIHMLQTGQDGRFGTPDDVVTFINVAAYGSDDPEDPEFFTPNGHLYFVDGVGTEIYDIDPVDGVFGNGNDIMTHFDISAYGNDFEGLASDPARGTLLVGARTTRKIYEISTTGTHIRTIDASGIAGMKYISGLTTAPASDGSGRTSYWVVDRAIDNNAVASENDGRMFELTIPSADAPPTVSITQPTANATVAGTVTLAASAGDDNAVANVRFDVDGTTIGIDSTGADGWSISWDSTTVGDGSHTITATATDSIGQTAATTRSVTVNNVDGPPTVTLDAIGSPVGGSVTLIASATDDTGVSSVSFTVDGSTIGTDSNGVDGWAAQWDTTSVTEGSHTVQAVAIDNTGQQGVSAPQAVTVDNTAPTISVTSPAANATVSGVTVLTAGVTESGGVASVSFSVDGTPVGTDTSASGGWTFSWDSRGVANGPHSVTARATDLAGNTAESLAVAVLVDNPLAVELAIAAGTDDAEEKVSKGAVTATSDDLDMMLDKSTPMAAVGLRFTNVPIPPGATITAATIRFRADEKGSTATTLTFSAQASDNAPSFTTAKFGISTRAKAPGTVSWAPAAWNTVGESGSAQTTPDLSALVQQIISRPGWSQGNAVVFIVTGSGSGTRVADSFEGGGAAVLHIEWAMP
ncbi:MAG: Ig-like domain-containing protein [Acidimicrobiia bacterium]|nr:Ig-like domain-containing protein [Acidimicrobiia bacterium]